MKRDPYSIVKCNNAKCGHFMDKAHRHLKFPDHTTPKENVHASIDETLSAPLVYWCAACYHFTIIGRNQHVARVLKRAGQK